MILQREAIIKYNEQFYFFAFHFLGPTSLYLILIRLSVTQWAMTYLLSPYNPLYWESESCGNLGAILVNYYCTKPS